MLKTRGRSRPVKTTAPINGMHSQPQALMKPEAGSSQSSALFAGICCAILAVTCVWSYWPTIISLIDTWNKNPDYSHGYFVVPIAVYFLWARRGFFPGIPRKLAWAGLLVLAASIGLRFVAARFFLGGVDGWSLPLWLAGAVWFLAGAEVLWWSLPSVVFLWYMVPLPYGMERWLSLPLQRIATVISCWTLHCFGQPALAEGNTILLNDFHLEVEQACSGLRIFVGILALAFVYLVRIRRSWWERALLIFSVIPVALISNATRIVATALLYQFVSSEAAHKFTHDMAGWIMIPYAAALFALVLWYLGSMFCEEEQIDVGDVLRQGRAHRPQTNNS
jgi:exosortase